MANIKKYQMRRLTIKGGAVQQLQVQGTDINVLRFINWGQNELRISQNSDPQNYPEVIISGNGGTNNMMDPAGISRVFIYAAADVSIGLVEIQMDDPMLILAMESVVANLLTSLPAGTAHVGSVSVDQGGVPVAAGNPFPVAVKGSLPAGTDIIGKVGMDPANNGVSLTVSNLESAANVKGLCDFKNKTAGDLTDNPNVAKFRTTSDLTLAPSSGLWFEHTTNGYAGLIFRDGVSTNSNTAASGQYALQLFVLDALEEAKRTNGLASTWTVSDLRTQLQSLILSCTVSGSGSNGGVSTAGATVELWNNGTSVWDVVGSNGASSPADIVFAITDFVNYIDANGRVHARARSTYAATGAPAVSAVINADACRLDFKARGAYLHERRVVNPDVNILTTTPLAAGANFSAAKRYLHAIPGVAAMAAAVRANTPVKVEWVTIGADGEEWIGLSVVLAPIAKADAVSYGRTRFIRPFFPNGKAGYWRVTNPSGTPQTELHFEEYVYTQHTPVLPQNQQALLVWNLQIRDITNHRVGTDPQTMFALVRSDCGGGKIPIYVNNGLDQAITLQPELGPADPTNAVSFLGVLGSTTVPAASKKVITNADFPGLDVPSEVVRVNITASVAPTAGAVYAMADNTSGGGA